MSKRKLTSLMLVSAVILGFFLGSLLTGQVNAQSSNSNLLEQLRVFSQVLRYVKANYVEDVESEELVNSAVRGMLEQLDPHSTYVEPEMFSRMNERNTGEYEGIGISFEIRDGWITVISTIEGGPSANLGIRPGDRIVAIEGESSKGLANEDVVARLKGPKATSVTITVARPGLDRDLSFTIVRDKIPIHSVPYSFMLDDGKTGYLRMIRFSATTAEELETALRELESQGMQQLVLDLRNNSGGFLNQAIEVTDRFIDGNQVIVYTKGRIDGSSQHYYSTDSITHPRYPLIVLVNHGSASASEIVSGAIQDHDRGLVAGQTTFGKGLVQRQYMLSDGSALLLTVARYYTPSGRLIQRPYTDREEYLTYWGGDADAGTDVEPDTTGRPIHYTLNEKRSVLGGGGIAPDIQIDDNVEFTDAQSRLEQSRLFFEFANEYATEHFTGKDTDFESFRRDWEVPEEALEQFTRMALGSEVVTFTSEELATEQEYIRRALKRELAGNLWGSSARYQVYLLNDATVATAIQHFPEAAQMAKLYVDAMNNQR